MYESIRLSSNACRRVGGNLGLERRFGGMMEDKEVVFDTFFEYFFDEGSGDGGNGGSSSPP